MSDQRKRSSWGTRRAFAEWGIAILALALLVNSHSRWLDLAWSFALLGLVVIGSCIVWWRLWMHRGKPGPAPLGQLAALPRSWQKWVLGETEDESPNKDGM